MSRKVGIDSFASRNGVWELQASPGYQMRTTKCVACARSKRVIAAWGFALLGREAHVVAFLLTTDAAARFGTVHYRGWRIDVLSYRVAAGWRPFIVIHGSERAVVPDAATLWDPVSTKAEADDYGVAKAREWIDKRF